MLSRIILIFILIGFFSACKEDKDDVFPTILISSPIEHARFNVLDVIPVRATISDNEKIQRIEISIRESATGNRVLSSIVLSPSTSQYELDQALVISDSLLESGDYSIRIDAGDGENTSSAFRSFFIQGIKRKSLGVILALDKGSSAELIELDENQNQRSLISTTDCGELSVNSKFQQLWYTIPGIEKVASINLNETSLEFEAFPNANGQSDQIYDALRIDDRYYVSTSRSNVQAFSPGYQDVFTYQGQNGHRVEELFPIGNRIMIREVDGQGNNQSLLYLFSNGAVETRSANSADIIGFGYRESNPDEAFEFINQVSDLDIRTFNLNNGLSTSLLSRANLNLESLIQISEYQYLLLSSASVYQYNLSSNFLRSLASNLNSPKVTYDEVEKVVYIASGSELRAVDYETAGTISNTNFSAPIIDLDVRYNK